MVGLLALSPFTHEPIAAALQLSACVIRQAFGELVNSGLLLRPTKIYEVSYALIHTYTHLQMAPPPEAITHLVDYYITFVADHQSEFT